jgi:hypothetical protein
LKQGANQLAVFEEGEALGQPISRISSHFLPTDYSEENSIMKQPIRRRVRTRVPRGTMVPYMVLVSTYLPWYLGTRVVRKLVPLVRTMVPYGTITNTYVSVFHPWGYSSTIGDQLAIAIASYPTRVPW